MARKKTDGARDEFPPRVKDALARRVGVRCSNRGCRRPTSGPHEDPAKALSIGVAAHITAAAPGGPRYDASLTEEERASAENGIWLCQNCAKLVDNDVTRYTVDLLREWKRSSEQDSLRAIESPHGEGSSKNQTIKDFLDALQQISVAPHRETPPDAAIAGIMSSLAASLVENVQAAVFGESTVPRMDDLQLGYDLEGMILEPPPLVHCLCERETAVEGVTETLHSTTWLSIRGESGCGKTQLAALAARRYAGGKYWLRFRDLNSQQAAVRLDLFLREIHEPNVGNSYREWIGELIRKLPENTLFVFDDLPLIQGEDRLAVRLLLLGDAIQGTSISILSMSWYDLPAAFDDQLFERFRRMNCPVFTDAEATELIVAHGAPRSSMAVQSVRLLNVFAQGNPILLVAIANYLQENNWRFTTEEIDELVQGKHTHAIAGETLTRVMNSVTDENSRSLLYRLKLVVGEFSSDEMDAVASVDPEIDRALERLQFMVGLWVQCESNDRYILSPTIRALPDTNLTEATRRDVHLALGARILQRRVLDPTHLVNAIMHFHGAGQVGRAAALLMQGLRAVLEKGELGDAHMLLLIWGDMPLPDQVSITLQIFLRAHQIEARSRYDHDVDFVISDLERLVNAVSDEESWALISAVAVAGKTLTHLHPILANHILLRVAQSWKTWRGPDGQPIPPPEGQEPEEHLWMSVGGLRTREHIRDWFDTVQELTTEGRENLFAGDLADSTCIVLADRLWAEEHLKPEESRDWDQVLTGLDEIIGYGEEWRQPYLKACAVRAKIIVVAEYKDDLQGAVDLAEEMLQEVAADPRAEFLIRECIARQYLFRRLYSESRNWFERALAEDLERPMLQRAIAFAHASHAFGQEDATAGVPYAEEAVQIGSRIQEMAEIGTVQLLGELAIARGFGGDLPGSFDAMDRAAEALLACATRDEDWKGLFMRFGHTSGYFAGLARTGKPPEEARDGDPWAPPPRGFFLHGHTGVAELYADVQANGIFVHLVLFAEAVANTVCADNWSLRGLEAARKANLPSLIASFGGLALTHYTTEAAYNEAFDLGIESARCTVASKYMMEHRNGTVWDAFDVVSVLENASGELAADAIRHGVLISIPPILFHLATRRVSSETEPSEDAALLVEHIERVSSSSPCSEYLLQIADVLRRVFMIHESGTDLIRSANRQEEWVIKSIAYMGASLDPEISLRDAARAHLAILPAAATVFDQIVGTCRRIVVPFVEEYWRIAFARERFRFSAPSEVEQNLSKAALLPSRERSQAVLRTIATSLGVQIHDGAKSWLYGSSHEQS